MLVLLYKSIHGYKSQFQECEEANFNPLKISFSNEDTLIHLFSVSQKSHGNLLFADAPIVTL